MSASERALTHGLRPSRHALQRLVDVSNAVWRANDVEDPQGSEPVQRGAIPVLREVFGADHPSTALVVLRHAWTLSASGRHAEALPLAMRLVSNL